MNVATTSAGELVVVSASVAALTGYTQEDWNGQKARSFFARTNPDERERMLAP